MNSFNKFGFNIYYDIKKKIISFDSKNLQGTESSVSINNSAIEKILLIDDFILNKIFLKIYIK